MRSFPPFWQLPASAWLMHAGKFLPFLLYSILCAALGRGLLRTVLRMGPLNRFETASFGFALGLGVVGLGSFALGCAGLLTPIPLYSFTALLTAAAVVLNSRGEKAVLAEDDPCPDVPSKMLAVAVISLLGFVLYHALAPDIFFDSLVYHLALPHLYRMEGGLVATPTNLYSGLPMLLQWNYAFLMFFGDEISAKLLQWGCSAALAAGFVGLGLRISSPFAGWTAAALFFSTPLVLYNAPRAGVDVGSSLLAFCSLYALALSLKEPKTNESAAAIFCGLLLGVKYPNWTMLPALAWALGADRKRRAMILTAGALLLLAPWVLKNLFLYGNPIFPYLNDLIRPGAEFQPSWRLLQESGWGRDWGVLLKDPAALLKVLLHPWFISVSGSTEFDHVGPGYLLLLPVVISFRPGGEATRIWARTLFAFWILWWPLTAMPRYFMPGLALFSVLAALSLASVRTQALKISAAVLLIVLSLDSAAMVAVITGAADSTGYMTGRISKNEYLGETRKTYPASYHRAALWLDANLPADSRVLILGSGRGLYIPRPFLASTQYDQEMFTALLARSARPEDLYRALRAKGATHLFVNLAWIWGQDPQGAVGEAPAALLEEFGRRHLKLIFADVNERPPRWILVYEISEKANGPATGLESLSRWYRVKGRSGLGLSPL